MPEEKKPEIHPSRMDTMARCPKQYEFRYEEGLKLPPGAAAYIGTGTHAAVEADLTAKKDTGKLLTIEEVRDIAAESVKAEWQGEPPRLSDDEKDIGSKTIEGRSVDMAISLAGLHHVAFAPMIVPTHVERPWVLELKDFPFNLAGRLDVQEADAVRDTKTAGKSPQSNAAHRSVQLTAYSLAVKTIDGVNPKEVSLDVLVKTKTPKPVRVVSSRSDADYRIFLLQVEAMAKVIESGAYYPTHPDNWICSKKWCGYYESVCPFGARRRVQI